MRVPTAVSVFTACGRGAPGPGLIGFLAILAAALLVDLPIQLNVGPETAAERQLERLNPDARLYYSLAENLATGAGYVDTLRKHQILPPIGHPLILAVTCVKLGISPAQLALWSLTLSLLLLAISARIYCRSNVFVLGMVGLYAAWLANVEWLAGNVETSIAVTSALAILCLAGLYRWDFSIAWAAAAGAALCANLLVRPIYLYPLHAASVGTLALAAWHIHRRRPAPLPRAVKGWAVLLVTAQGLLMAVAAISEHAYGDRRLTTGTYGAWSLYAGNNAYLPVGERYVASRDKRDPGFRRMAAVVNSPLPWQERERFFLGQTLAYWREQPGRALHGWWWRFRIYLGLHAKMIARRPDPVGAALWGPRLHAAVVLALLALLAARSWRAGRAGVAGFATAPTLGAVVALMFGLYAAVHALFLYVNFRYVTPCAPTLVAAVVFLSYETWQRRAGGAAIADEPAR